VYLTLATTFVPPHLATLSQLIALPTCILTTGSLGLAWIPNALFRFLTVAIANGPRIRHGSSKFKRAPHLSTMRVTLQHSSTHCTPPVPVWYTGIVCAQQPMRLLGIVNCKNPFILPAFWYQGTSFLQLERKPGASTWLGKSNTVIMLHTQFIISSWIPGGLMTRDLKDGTNRSCPLQTWIMKHLCRNLF